MDLTNYLSKALDKFNNYDDLSMMMKRYRDILITKTPNLSSDSEFAGEKTDKYEKDKSSSSKTANGDKKKKKDRSKDRDREKRKNVIN